MTKQNWFENHWITLDYCIILPILARLPFTLGRQLASLRGLIYAKLMRDWRQFTFDDRELYSRTKQSINIILPDADKTLLARSVVERYQMQSIEEWEAACIIRGSIFKWPVVYEGLDKFKEVMESNSSLILLTAHFSSSILGVVLLGRLGIPVLGMSSNIVDNPKVHPMISRFYRKKYDAMSQYLNGGMILDRQGNSFKFVHFLNSRGIVVIVADLPPEPKEKPVVRSFFGEMRCFAPGPVKLARITNKPLLAFVCDFRNGSYHLRFSPTEEDPYSYIERSIRETPSRWWAADLLPLLPSISK